MVLAVGILIQFISHIEETSENSEQFLPSFLEPMKLGLQSYMFLQNGQMHKRECEK